MSSLFYSSEEVKIIHALIADGESTPGPGAEVLQGDGSARRFFRLLPVEEVSWPSEQHSLIAALPPLDDNAGLAEALASFNIGMHLYHKNVPVPKLYGFDPACGMLLFEDLGDIHLHTFVKQHNIVDSMDWYEKTLDELIHFQVEGRHDFCTQWCHDTKRYDMRLMLERESGYFVQRFWQGYLKQENIPEGLWDEFKMLAGHAALVPNDYLLHRDFQSRNIMIHQKTLRIIDFQGARLGPLAYDVSALLLDPYVNLEEDIHNHLLEVYIEKALKKISLDRHSFLKDYYYIALQRNLQILGAFGYLTLVGGKVFFHQFIDPALASLRWLLRQPAGNEFPILMRLVDKASEHMLNKTQIVNMDVQYE